MYLLYVGDIIITEAGIGEQKPIANVASCIRESKRTFRWKSVQYNNTSNRWHVHWLVSS